MKQVLFIFLFVLSSKLFSQTLTQSFNEPIVGDTERTYPIDTSGFTTGMPTSITGSNSVWNFTKLIITNSVIPNAYVSPSAVSSSSSYAGCNLVLAQGPLNNFYKSTTTPTTQTELLGFRTGTLALTFTNTAIVAKYPISFGSTITDNISGTFVFTVSGTCSGSLNTVADGLGTLQLPNGLSLSNVLRIKSVQTLSLSATLSTLIPIPLQIGTIKQTSYYYFHSSNKFPVLTISYQSLSFLGSATPSITGIVSGNAKILVSNVRENMINENLIKVYPNPFSSSFNIENNNAIKIESIKVFDAIGHLIFVNSNSKEVDLSTFTKGIYLLEIQTQEGILRKKLIKE
jgi:hypothetical protein